jgi:hypothetical protein
MSDTNKYRKKPVVVSAWHFDGSFESARDPIAQGLATWSLRGNGGVVRIQTLEGTMEAAPGDWIIQGVKGELYPCKPDIFAATYDPADTPPDTITLPVRWVDEDYGLTMRVGIVACGRIYEVAGGWRVIGWVGMPMPRKMYPTADAVKAALLAAVKGEPAP